MGFGKKGLAPGQAQAAGHPRQGIGGTQPSFAPPVGGPSNADDAPDDIAARRQAFVASERARRAEAEAVPSQAPKPVPVEPAEHDPLINLRNMAPSKPRAARPMGDGVDTSGGMSAAQETEIRSAARGMARNQPARYGAGASGGLPPSAGSYGGGSGGRRSGGGSGFIFGDPATRNIGLAYVLWFFLGQFSVHRFYCGETQTAWIQMGMWITSLVFLFVFPPLGLIGLLAWICWLVGDLFMIPGMLSKFQSQHDYRGVFA